MKALVLRTARDAPGWTALYVPATLALAVSSLLMPFVLARAVAAVIGGGDAFRPVALLCGLVLAEAAITVLSAYAVTTGCAHMTARLRRRLAAHVLALGVPGGRVFSVGDLTVRLSGNAEEVADVVPDGLAVVVSGATALGGLAGLWLIDWRLAAVLLIGLPVAAFLTRSSVFQFSDAFGRYQQAQGRLAARLLDALRGARTIRASGSLEREIARVSAVLPELSAAGRDVWSAQRRTSWRLSLLTPVLEVAVLATAGFAVAAGDLEPAQLTAAAGYLLIAVNLLWQLDSLSGLLSLRESAARVSAVLAEPAPRPGDRELAGGPGTLTLREAAVASAGLSGVALTVPAGASVAVVGRSGAGKSTLAMLAGRLADPDSGVVALDGQDLRLAHARPHIGYAFERPVLLGETIEDAIAYGMPEATRAQIERAAGAAQADRFIRLLPRGYDTPLEAAPMSGGERQRIGLARALLREARLTILDDATSSLDTVTESQVREAITATLAGRTRLVVAHRAATAARADLVAWLDGGRVRAFAPHAELWAQPEYREVFGA
ncbi:ABC transporter ATP-binding protein [Acrocarpospora phusangensis]|uniref:ABC transporter ATP-binding protein n=1 Tax=Acrocarpospora phusangensis TaxID=1070424 RepID=A0A919QBY3_9ACTN|nr:ABC transporter ATP-binding protein [Acrocarpospora phusangensis]GIH23830.1 ABC transporter ATP-binding protein [Acrocarpospora phusangensis]